MADDEREQLKFHWGDRVYTADDLTIADVIAIEEEMGEPFTEIDWRAMKPVTLLVALARAHELDGTPFEKVLSEVRSVKVGTLAEQMDASGAAANGDGQERPTDRRSRSGASKRTAKPARAGKRGTSSTPASPPGTSAD